MITNGHLGEDHSHHLRLTAVPGEGEENETVSRRTEANVSHLCQVRIAKGQLALPKASSNALGRKRGKMNRLTNLLLPMQAVDQPFERGLADRRWLRRDHRRERELNDGDFREPLLCVGRVKGRGGGDVKASRPVL
jgi:hypothetical protein